MAAIQAKPFEDIINAGDERMAQQESKRSAEQSGKSRTNASGASRAVHGLTSVFVVSTSVASTGAISAASGNAGREAREVRILGAYLWLPSRAVPDGYHRAHNTAILAAHRSH